MSDHTEVLLPLSAEEVKLLQNWQPERTAYRIPDNFIGVILAKRLKAMLPRPIEVGDRVRVKGRTWTVENMVDLPDAEHIHVTRRPDGSIASAVPMRQAFKGKGGKKRTELWDAKLWVDAPEDGAR